MITKGKFLHLDIACSEINFTYNGKNVEVNVDGSDDYVISKDDVNKIINELKYLIEE